MASRELIFPLAKFIAAAAWADGVLSPDEVNSLKDWLVRQTDLSGEDWQRVKMFLDHPVPVDELELLFQAVLVQVHSDDDKAFVRQRLLDLVKADSEISPAERELLADVEKALDGCATGPIARLGQLVHGTFRSGQSVPTGREEHFSDYVHNPVYYHLAAGQGVDSTTASSDLRKLCLIAGALARAGKADLNLSDTEAAVVADVLCEQWGAERRVADRIAAAAQTAAAKGFDGQRVLHRFRENSPREECVRLVSNMFRVANAEGGTSLEEIEAIRSIAKMLRLSHKEFIDAKLTIPRRDRSGM